MKPDMTAPVLMPDTPDALTERALRRVQEYMSKGLFDAAEAAAVTQAKRTPQRFDVWLVASFAHAACGHLRAAQFAIQRALGIQPDQVGGLLQLARVAMANGRTAVAFGAARRLAEQHVLDLDPGLRVVEIFNRLGECEDAQTLIFRLQTRLTEASIPLMLAQAETYTLAGDIDDAAAIYEELIRVQPRMGYARLALARLRPERALFEPIPALLREVKPGTDSEVWLLHAAFRILDARGDYAEAAQYLERGLRSKRRQYQYQLERELPVFERLKTITQEIQAAVSESSLPQAGGPMPIFVIGLPGSGANLVERVLGNHPDVRNGGELPEFAALVRETSGVDANLAINDAILERLPNLDWEQLGARYRERIRERFPLAQAVTDLGSGNVLFAAAILRALPEARLIHVVCEPMEQCFALLREWFDEQYPFSNEQSELVRYYLAYSDWMRTIESAFPKRVLSVRYEQWRAVPGLVSRAIFRFCELQFEPGHEDPSRNRRPIGYGSMSRRQTVPSAAASESWRNYRTLLAPMQQLLADAGLVARDV